VYNGVDTLLIPGIAAIRKALYNTPCNPAQTNPAARDYCGISQALGLVQQGIPQLVDGIANSISSTLLAGVGAVPPTAGCDPTKTLTCAAAALDAGSAQLASGSAQVAAGAGQVNSGAQQLAGGSSQVADGASQVADGADQLASGLGDAASGASQIEAGLGQAADAVPQIRDGAQQLSTEGTQKLIAAGNSTALDFGEKYAMIEASAQTTADGGLPYGAPSNATVASAAYSFDIAGESGESGKNTSRGVAALLIGAGAAGAAMLIGRRFVL
jgi:putative membrane protein